MGRAYSQEQRDRVKTLLESGADEATIEKNTGVSDRTIRRWKLELERTGRIGKPPESRTGRHRVLNPEVENALFEHVKDKPDLSVDDMLWWLYDNYKIVVGTRTIRRVFERKGEAGNRFKKSKQATGAAGAGAEEEDDDEDEEESSPMQPQQNDQYQSPYALMATMTPQNTNQVEVSLAQALQQHQYPPPPNMMDTSTELPEDEETLQLQLEQIALQKREVELKLKMRRLQQGRSPATPGSVASRKTSTPHSSLSTLYKPEVEVPAPPKRDSRSKKKIEESQRRTAERQERMLRELERRSRRREHLTAEWVQSKDIWPLRAQSSLANLMHQYQCYAFTQNTVDTFEAMYHDLYQLVDHSKGDWNAQHDEMLRERMKRKMGQLRTKMQKTGEIIGRGDGYGGWSKAENYTGQQAGDMMGEENELELDLPDPISQQQQVVDPSMQQAQPGAMGPPQHVQPPQGVPHDEQQIQYEPLPDPTQQQMQHAQLPYGQPPMMHHQAPGQYPMMDHNGMMPYGQMPPQGMTHQDGMM